MTEERKPEIVIIADKRGRPIGQDEHRNTILEASTGKIRWTWDRRDITSERMHQASKPVLLANRAGNEVGRLQPEIAVFEADGSFSGFKRVARYK